MFKEKLGICLYEENCYEEEIIKVQDEGPMTLMTLITWSIILKMMQLVKQLLKRK